MSKIKILIADDHAVVRMGLSALFRAKGDFDIVGQARDGEEAVSEVVRHKPDIVVMDLMMPKANGIEATEAIRRAAPSARILVLTSYTTTDGIAQALKAGASGAVLKNAETAELVEANRAEAVAIALRKHLVKA